MKMSFPLHLLVASMPLLALTASQVITDNLDSTGEVVGRRDELFPTKSQNVPFTTSQDFANEMQPYPQTGWIPIAVPLDILPSSTTESKTFDREKSPSSDQNIFEKIAGHLSLNPEERNQRAISGTRDTEVDIPFLARIKTLECNNDIQQLVIDVLESSLKHKKLLLNYLKMQQVIDTKKQQFNPPQVLPGFSKTMNSDEMIPDRDSGILDIVDRTNGSRRLIPSQVFHRSEAKGGERLSVQQFLQKYPEVTTTIKPPVSLTTPRPIVTTRRLTTSPNTTPRPTTPTAKLRRSSTSPTSRPTLKTSLKVSSITPSEGAKSPDFVDDNKELSSDDFSYFYSEEYYDELVPEHHRFLQLEASALASNNGTTKPRPGGSIKNQKANRANSNVHLLTKTTNQAGKQGSTSARENGLTRTPLPGFTPPQHSLKVKVVQSTTSSPVEPVSRQKPPPVQIFGNPNQSGPFGYIDKGTFFTDESFTEFPEKIEVVFQGFVWSIHVTYPTEGQVTHGGVHDVLKDQVKRDTIVLRDDHIVRVEGRASPYNINRITFFTAKGKQFGPLGDRRSQESIDFDVSAPPGHALAFFSGTIDFGIPLRSISFHWRPISS